MGATRESLLRISSSSGSGGGGGGSGGREGGKEGGVETDAWRSLVVINGVLAECVRANDTKGATQMLRMMVKAQQAADLSTFNALLAVYSERGDVGTCVSLLETMRSTELARPDALSYAHVINACLQRQWGQEGGEEGGEEGEEMQRAVGMMEEAIEIGMLKGSKELWDTRLRLFAWTSPSLPSSPLDDLSALLFDADSAGHSASLPLLSEMLAIFTRRRQFHRATALFSALRWQRVGFPPSSPPPSSPPSSLTSPSLSSVLPPPTRGVYQTMLQAFCSSSSSPSSSSLAHGWPVALTLLKRMQSRALPSLTSWQLEATAPTRACYTSVVEGAVKAGDMAGALK
ncbi:hypothetical protein VYU27_010554, partial [Nannochloropsis oceanica]